MRARNILAAALSILVSSEGLACSLAPPAGYTTAQLTFDDSFVPSSLDTTHWNAWLGNDTYGRWSDQGNLASPYSGYNCPSNTCGNDLEYFDPFPYGYGTSTSGQHLTGGVGQGNLNLTAAPSSHFSSLGYSWASAAISSYGKVYLPATGGYVQIHAQMPDSRYGAWGGLWFMSQNSTDPEIDLMESGFTLSGSYTNNVMASNFHAAGATQVIQGVGRDLSAAFHTYGLEYKPGVSLKMYLDGTLMATYTSNIPSSAYELIFTNQMASSATSGWHTVADATNHPGPFNLRIDDVQIYSLP